MTDSIRDSSFIRRSMTRNSHYSHTSTQSWVLSNQQNPPPPPEMSEPIPSPIRTPRPLPDPQLQPHHQTQALRPTNADPIEDEEEQMSIDANAPGMQVGRLIEDFAPTRTPRPLAAAPSPLRNQGSREGRSLVSGFVSGLKRLPKTVLKYGSVGEKRKFVRRGTFGSGVTVTSATGMTTGNTLPLYVSNPPTPVAGPSNTQYVEAMEMPTPFPAQEAPSVILGPSLSQRRRNPSFRVTPPSEERAEQEDDTAPQHAFPPDPPQFVEGMVESPRNANTVTIYHLPGQENYPLDEPPLPMSAPTPNRRPDVQLPSILDPPPAEEPQSPVLAHPAPASDYRKMTLSASPLSPRTLTTSLSSDPSFSSELNPVKRFFLGLYHLPWIAPERVTIDYRPPGHRGIHREGRSMVKKPMSSWYKGTPGVVLSIKGGGGSGELDLLSSGTPSRRASSGTSATPLTTAPNSPAQVRHYSSDRHRRHHHRHRGHQRHTLDESMSERNRDHRAHRHRNTTPPDEMQQRQNAASPIIPAVYPYPYSYPYTYPGFPMPAPQRTHSASTPRGPRPHRTQQAPHHHHHHHHQQHPHGYAPVPYQPPQPPPPVYVIHSPANSNNNSEGVQQGQTQVLSPVYAMQFMPGLYNQEPVSNGATPIVPPSDVRVEA